MPSPHPLHYLGQHVGGSIRYHSVAVYTGGLRLFVDSLHEDPSRSHIQSRRSLQSFRRIDGARHACRTVRQVQLQFARFQLRVLVNPRTSGGVLQLRPFLRNYQHVYRMLAWLGPGAGETRWPILLAFVVLLAPSLLLSGFVESYLLGLRAWLDCQGPSARVVWQANLLYYAFLAIAGCGLLWREMSK